MNGIIYLEDGTVYYGKSFGMAGTSTGELVFNTSMTGYQEILTDPSYAGQVINMTYPLIGNYGVNDTVNQSSKAYARGLIVKSISHNPSNYMSQNTINEMLKKMGIVGIHGVDTRSITKKIRGAGALKCVISSEDLSADDINGHLSRSKYEDSLMDEVSTREVNHIPGKGPKISVVDFGIKANILKNLMDRGCDITIFPYHSSYECIMSTKPDGVLLSNGPGDPKNTGTAIETVKKLLNKVPVFGICLGHQILSLALGGDTYKMKYGHRGGNHGVYDIERDRAYITSQNHGYAVDRESIEEKGLIITHVNLNDDTVEGMRHSTMPVFSVQFHPEGSPGPTDSSYLFDNFLVLMKGEIKCQ